MNLVKAKPEFRPMYRLDHGILIYFKDKRSILVAKDKTCILFHRWNIRQKGFYSNNWYPFVRYLKRHKTFKGIYEICNCADKYDIDHQVVTREFKTLIPRGVEEYKWRPYR